MSEQLEDLPPPTIDPDKLLSFEQAFSDRTSGAHHTCNCGKDYVDNHNRYDGQWEEEKERAIANGSIPVGHAITILYWQGRYYSDCCQCWKHQAAGIIRFLDDNVQQVAGYINREKERLTAAANQLPTVKAG